MKKILCILLITLAGWSIPSRATAQAEELEELILDISKLAELKSILKEMKEGYEILTKGYNAVKDISQGSFNLHKAFLDALLTVSPTVKKYVRIVDIINAQQTLVKEYTTALSHFKNTGLFSSADINYLQSVYNNLFNRSLQNLDELTMIITDSQLRASDAERLAAIDRIYRDMEDKVEFLRHFNNNAGLLATQRQKALDENKALQGLYSAPD